MNTKLLAVLALLAIMASAGAYNDFIFNPGNCRTERYDGWDALSCDCSGGSGDYQYEYTNLPPGWQAINQKLYIPRGRIQGNKVYGCKLSVFDKKMNRYMKRALLFNYDRDNKFGNIYDADFDFDFDNRVNVENFINNRFRNNNLFFYKNWANGAIPTGSVYGVGYQPSAVVTNYGGQIVSPNFPSQVVVPNYPSQVVLPSQIPVVNPSTVVGYNGYSNVVPSQYVSGVGYDIRRVDDDIRIRNPYYEAYPTDDECQRAISDGDCGKIRDYIKYVSESKFECKKRAEFLEKFDSRIDNRIAAYRSDADKLKQAILTNQEKIKQLKEKAEKVEIFNSDQVNERIRKYREQISRYNRDRDDYQVKCKGTRDSIFQVRQQIENIKAGTTASRIAIEQEQMRMRDIDGKIGELQARLRELRDARQQSRRKRQYHQRIIDESIRRIDDCNIKIGGYQKFIDEYDTKSKYYITNIDDFNRKIEGCNKQIEGYRSRQGQFKSEQIAKKIYSLEQEITVNTKQVDRLVRIYTELQKYENEFEESIDKHYYACYQYLPPKNDPTKRGHYTIESQSFYRYLKDVFGQAPSQNIRARFTGVLDVKRLSPLSVSWTKVYGIPATVGYGSNMDKAEDNFLCTESADKLKVFNAKIEQINKNVIKACGRNGEKFVIHLGGCTRMQLISDKDLPQIGQQIMFKGFERSPFDVYAHHVSCY